MKIHCKTRKDNEKGILEKLFHYRRHADVLFMCGAEWPEMVRAHTLILMTASEKFEELIESHDPEKPIPVPDIESNVFVQLLKVIYLNYFDIDSVKMKQECLKAFKKFGLNSAAETLEEFFKYPENVTDDTAILMYEVNRASKTYSNVVKRCIQHFKTETRGVLKSPSFARANLDTILRIFDKSPLNIQSEIDLVDALSEYAKKNDALPGHNSGGDDAQFALRVKPALAKIRLLTLTPKEFLESESVRVLLTNDQIISVIAHINLPKNGLYTMPHGLSTCKVNRTLHHQVVEKGHRIITELIEQAETAAKAQKACKLIQDLIDGTADPEFCEDSKSQQDHILRPWAVEFFKQNLPVLRQALATKQLVIEGIYPSF